MTRYDVIVVGLGGMGAATLEASSRRGARVLGLERGHILRHGKGRSHASSRGFRQTYPHESYRALAANSRAYWEGLPWQDGRRIFEPCGATISAPPGHRMLSGVRGAARALGVQCVTLSSPQQAASFPGLPPGYETIFEPDAGWIRASAAIEAMCAMATGRGAEIRCGVEVTHITRDGAGDVIVCGAGGRAFRARAAVLCTAGVRVKTGVSHHAEPLVFRRQVEHWVDVRGVLKGELFEHGEGMFHVLDLAVEGIDDHVNLYGMLERPGLLKCCMQHPRYDVCRDDPSQFLPVGASEVDALYRTLWALWPAARGRTSLLRSRVGWNVETSSGEFLLGAESGSSRIIRAQAFCGHGYKMFPALAERVCDLIQTAAP